MWRGVGFVVVVGVVVEDSWRWGWGWWLKVIVDDGGIVEVAVLVIAFVGVAIIIVLEVL